MATPIASGAQPEPAARTRIPTGSFREPGLIGSSVRASPEPFRTESIEDGVGCVGLVAALAGVALLVGAIALAVTVLGGAVLAAAIALAVVLAGSPRD